jgi:DNA mismatch endonuclease (patch repair protein)
MNEMDNLTREQRSEIMGRVRNRDTVPERIVRSLVFSMGYRYRLHSKSLPGRPDLVFPGRRKVIMVNGCFWHRHEGCALARVPKSRVEFWLEKLEENRKRDEINAGKLNELGWRLLVVWECEIKKTETLRGKICVFLEEDQ